ncbi:MAG: flagellar biosynthetic protein FliR [Epsilonproteobacteria bacterium]|nr:flagellar biosynthetic protein FliR [Campylobacterota bacterium]NPA56887.1 flagellar biosynthetic protein FliR [Campylobacterota bacterium]
MNPIITPQESVAFILILTRVTALFISFPFFNTPMVPHTVKAILLLILTLFFMKVGGITPSLEEPLLWRTLLPLIARELLIGFALAILVKIFIAAFSYAAEIISFFMGLTVVNSFDPTYGQVSALSRFFLMLFYFLFFVSDGYRYFLSSILLSFERIPIGQLTLDQGIWRYIIEISGKLFPLALQLAFPFALILYLINLSLALVNRLIPQINVFMVGLPLQIFVGLAALAFGAGVILYRGVDLLREMGEDSIALLKHLG